MEMQYGPWAPSQMNPNIYLRCFYHEFKWGNKVFSITFMFVVTVLIP